MSRCFPEPEHLLAYRAASPEIAAKLTPCAASPMPATFGGVERHVEELGSRLAERGHSVTVYGRTNYVREPRTEYRGMHVRNLPTVNSKHLDAIVHSGISTLDACIPR